MEELPLLVEDSDDTPDGERKAAQEDSIGWIPIGSNASYGVSSADWGVNTRMGRDTSFALIRKAQC